jgi:hypothetical protein
MEASQRGRGGTSGTGRSTRRGGPELRPGRSTGRMGKWTARMARFDRAAISTISGEFVPLFPPGMLSPREVANCEMLPFAGVRRILRWIEC